MQREKPWFFADRFPLRYFADAYGLDYYAAYPGCADAAEPSAATVAFLIDKVRAEGYVILDVDSVIAAQAPKLSPYREAMRENLAAAMGIAVENVGVKATTTEHLGFEGREEGISATAVCLLCRRPDEQRD